MKTDIRFWLCVGLVVLNAGLAITAPTPDAAALALVSGTLCALGALASYAVRQ